MKRAAIAGIGVVVVVAVAAGAWELAAPRVGEAVLDRSVADFRASLGPNGSFTYSAAQAHPADRSASFDNVKLKLADGTTVTAQHVDLAPGSAHKLRHIHSVQTVISGRPAAPGTTIEIADMTGDDLTNDASVKPVPAPTTPDTGLALLKPELRDQLIHSAQIAQHLSADDLLLKGVRVSTNDPAAQTASGTIDTIHIHDLGPGQSTDVEIKTLAATAVPFSAARSLARTTPALAPDAPPPPERHADISIGDLTVHNARISDELAYLAAGRSDGGRTLSQPSDITLTDATALVHGPDQSARLHVGSVKIVQHATAPHSDGNLDVNDLEIPAGKLAALVPDAVVNGALHGKVTAHSTGDFTTGQSSVHPLQISFDHLLTLRVSSDITADPTAIRSGLTPAEALSHISLSALSIGLQDDGLRQALLNRAAASGAAPDAVAAGIAARAQIVLAAFGPAGASIAPAIANFIQKGGALQIDGHLAHPLPLQEFAHPASQDAIVGLFTSLAPTATQSATLPPLAN